MLLSFVLKAQYLWKNNVKVGFKETDGRICTGLIWLTTGTVAALVNIVMNVGVNTISIYCFIFLHFIYIMFTKIISFYPIYWLLGLC
jgi:hypothetical protein